MKRFAAFLLLVAVVTQAFWNLGVFGYWAANRDFIAKNLCVNRDKPASCCEGKCYLEKNLVDNGGHSEQEKDSSFEKVSLQKGIELAEVPSDLAFFPLKIVRAVRLANFPTTLDWAELLREKGIFRPPLGRFDVAKTA